MVITDRAFPAGAQDATLKRNTTRTRSRRRDQELAAQLRQRSGRAGRRSRRRVTQTFARFVRGRTHIQNAHRQRQLNPVRRQRRPGSKPLRHDTAAGQHGTERDRTASGLFLRLVFRGNVFGRSWHRRAARGFSLGRGGRTARGHSCCLRHVQPILFRLAYTVFEREEHSGLHLVGPRPGQRLGRRVAAAPGEALIRRGATTGFVHAGKGTGAILASERLGG